MCISAWSSDVCSSDLTEPVVATDVIATQESAVRGGADRSADAPIGVDLKLAARVYIAADILFRGPRTAAGGDARTICDIAGDLIGALGEQALIIDLRHGKRVGIDVRRDGQVAIGRDLKIIGQRQLKPVDSVIAYVGDQQAAAAFAAKSEEHTSELQSLM